MNSRSFVPRLNNSRLTAAILVGGACLLAQFAPTGLSQAPTPLDPRALTAIGALVDQLKGQQDLMIANQTKIEAQTATLREEIRLVKIYSARGGSSLRH